MTYAYKIENMADSRLALLFERYTQGLTLTGEEEKELMSLLADSENKEPVAGLIDKLIVETGEDAEMQPESANAVLEAILQADKAPVIHIKQHKSSVSRFLKPAAAAVVVFAVATGVYWWINKEQQPAVNIAEKKNTIILPGGDKAVLKLADGSTIVLDTAKDGVLKSVGNVSIQKTHNGELVYMVGASSGAQDLAGSNTISTPRGGQYQVALPDGSRVWLNAASSVTFPTSFAASERKVEVTGEAYFEITADARRPFKVKVNAVEVEVLGTSFNVMSYPDEPYIKTTLLSGSVAVKAGATGKRNYLTPGQQASFSRSSAQMSIISEVDTDEIMGWKNGIFYMARTEIPAVMRQISRWYNVDIEYPQGMPQETISGKIPRSTSFTNVLDILGKIGVNLKQEGKKLLVYP